MTRTLGPLDGYLANGKLGSLPYSRVVRTRGDTGFLESPTNKQRRVIKLRHSFLYQWYRGKTDTIPKGLCGFADESIEIGC